MRESVREANARAGNGVGEPAQAHVDERQDDAKALAWAAETADGTRDSTMFLVVGGDGHLHVTDRVADSDREVRRIRTDSHQPGRRKVLEVSCVVDGWENPIRLPSSQKWDAVFWTESSVEKFLYPYYHAQRLWDPKMDALQHFFDGDPDAVAIAHQAPSNSKALGVEGSLGTIGVARLITLDGVPVVEWVSGPQYVAERRRQ